MSSKIEGGYYIKAKKIQDSEIAHAAPCVREVWDYLLRICNYSEKESSGRTIVRGQTVKTYQDIQEALSWFVGYRKETYSRDAIENAMKWLTKRCMITKSKTTRGIVITICNYDIYQNPASYEYGNDSHNETTMKPQCPATIIKEKEEIKEIKNNNLNPLASSDDEAPEEKPDQVETPEEKPEDEKDEKDDFIDELLNIFCEEYESLRNTKFDLQNKGKERKAIGKLLGLYKARNKSSPKDSDETKDDFRKIYRACINIPDDWYRDNMTPSLMNSKWNEIKTILGKNKHGSGKQPGATDEQILNSITRAWGQTCNN